MSHNRLFYRWCLSRHLDHVRHHQRGFIPEAVTQWLKWGREKRRIEAQQDARDNLRWGPNHFYLALWEATSTCPREGVVEARTRILAADAEQERQAQEEAKVWIQEIHHHFTRKTPLPHNLLDPWLVQQVRRSLNETHYL